MSRTGKKQHEAVLQIRHDRGPGVDGLDMRASIASKFDEVEAAKRGRVFILLPDVVAQNIAGDVKSAICQLLFGKRQVQIAGERLQNVDADACRRAQAGSRRDLRSQKQIDINLAAQVLQNRDRNLEAILMNFECGHVAPTLADSQVRGDDLDALIGAATQNGIEVLVNGGAEYSSAELLEIGGKVGSPTAKTNPHWAAYDEHSTLRPREIGGVRNRVLAFRMGFGRRFR